VQTSLEAAVEKEQSYLAEMDEERRMLADLEER
jgi:hypothetical protein